MPTAKPTVETEDNEAMPRNLWPVAAEASHHCLCGLPPGVASRTLLHAVAKFWLILLKGMGLGKCSNGSCFVPRSLGMRVPERNSKSMASSSQDMPCSLLFGVVVLSCATNVLILLRNSTCGHFLAMFVQSTSLILRNLSCCDCVWSGNATHLRSMGRLFTPLTCGAVSGEWSMANVAFLCCMASMTLMIVSCTICTNS